MTFEQISKDIIGRKFNPIYLLCGDEPHYIDKISELIISKVFSDEEKEFNQTILYGLDTDVLSVESEARKYPMMANYNVVIVKEAQSLKNIEELERYVEKPVPSTVFVLCYKKKFDKRKKFYKHIEKNGVCLESKKLYDNQVPDWISKLVSHAGFNI